MLANKCIVFTQIGPLTFLKRDVFYHGFTRVLIRNLCLLLMCVPCYAEDTALLIGVGKYINSAHNLPGIDIDIETMQSVSRQLGYTNTITLRDTDATKANILASLHALKSALGPTDRFLFYFSGHGTRVPDMDGDERDTVDEALATADVASIVLGDINTLQGVLVDDDLSAILQSFNTRHTLSIIDACHSGSVAKRSFLTPKDELQKQSYVKKRLDWPGINQFRRHSPIDYRPVSMPYISISSAGDDEYAIATESGSVFTRALKRALLDYANQQGVFENKPLTPYNLVAFTGDFIYQLVAPYERYTPEISGNPILFHQPLIGSEKNQSNENQRTKLPNTEKLNLLIQRNQLQLQPSKAHYQIGERLDLQVSLPHAGMGYLNVVHVDSQDNVRIIFPATTITNNKISFQAGNYPLSQLVSGAPLEITSSATGNSWLYTLITKTPASLGETRPTNQHNNPVKNTGLLVGKTFIQIK